MDSVAKTAYYCCGVRSADAAKPNPVCGDTYAQRFMDDDGRAVFANFTGFAAPNASNATRARIIDDWLKERITANPKQLVVLVGAGFDSRAYRLSGGRWVELDQAPLIARKNELLPVAECKNELRRITIDFASESLSDKLRPFAGEAEAIVVLEGVSQYLTQAQLRGTLDVLRAAFPRHTLICDLMSEKFRQRFTGKFRAELRKLGTDFETLVDNPAAAVAAAGYEEVARVSMVGRAVDLGAIRMPRFVLNLFLKPLRDGYCAYRFQARS
jgi:methyltransferase (TIGR00027 family)